MEGGGGLIQPVGSLWWEWDSLSLLLPSDLLCFRSKYNHSTINYFLLFLHFNLKHFFIFYSFIFLDFLQTCKILKMADPPLHPPRKCAGTLHTTSKQVPADILLQFLLVLPQPAAATGRCRQLPVQKGRGRHPGTPCPSAQPPHASADNISGQHTAASAAETHNGWHCFPIRLALFPNQLTPHLLLLYDYSDEGGRGGWGWVAPAHSRCWSKRSRLMR